MVSLSEYDRMTVSLQEYTNEQPFLNYAHHAMRKGSTSITKLHPWWVTDFVDAEGSFGINSHSCESSSYKVELQFKVSQNVPNK